jgi:5'-deoxynucleotidase YfbR-like HD superfamily hydrolase
MTHDVNRFHASADPALRNCGDTVNAHQQRVMADCHNLAARMGYDLTRSDLLRAARHHDEAEKIIGDMPGPAKDAFPALAAAYAKAELQILTSMGLTWNLTRIEAQMLDLCDKHDAYRIASRYTDISAPEWQEALAKLHRKAAAIGPAATAWLQDELSPKALRAAAICQFAGE